MVAMSALCIGLLQEDGRMRYDFDRQPPQTQEVHRRSCARQGMQPSRGVGMIAGKGPRTAIADQR